MRISKGTHSILSMLLSRIVEEVIHDHTTTDSETNLPIPTSENELRQYLNSKHAILKNIPIPDIHVLPNGDSYVLPSDFLWLYFSLCVVLPHMVRSDAEIEYDSDGISNV